MIFFEVPSRFKKSLEGVMEILLLDDKLEVYAQKCSTDGKKQRLPLSLDWKYEAYPIKVILYWVPGTDIHVPVYAYNYLSPAQRWGLVECYEYRIPCKAPDTYIVVRDNRFIIRMVKLSYGEESRLLSSRMALLVNEISSHRPEIFPYAPLPTANHPRGEAYSLRESTRQLIKTYFKPSAYEIGILITDPERGRAAFEEWKQRALNPAQPGDVFKDRIYLTGVSTRGEGGVSVIVYDHGAYHDGNPGLYKIEMTFRRKAFEHFGVSIEDFTTQENCMAPFKEDFFRRLGMLSSGPVTYDLAQEAPNLRPLASLVRSATEVKCA
jgi:hypothetical protein